MRRTPGVALFASLVLALSLLAPSFAAPVTAEDCAKPAGDWEALAKARIFSKDLPEAGVKMQIVLFDRDLLMALMPALAGSEDFPTDPEEVAAIVNALKPHDRSMVLYMAVRDREAEPTEWSPVFQITHAAFAMRLAADEKLTPFQNSVISPIGFHNLLEIKPTRPTDAWRALYLLDFKSETEYADFMDMPGILLEYRHPVETKYLNLTPLRSFVKLDPDHPDSTKSRPAELLTIFLEAFPPKKE